jgi:hypothetical protein
VVKPFDSYFTDANGDGMKDLVLFYDAAGVRTALASAGTETGQVGLHYSLGDGTQLLVPDILALGAPLPQAAAVDPEERPGNGRGDLRTSADGGGTTPPAGEPVPAVTRLVGIAPNPFQGATGIALEISTARNVHVNVYNLQGALVRSLLSGGQAAGRLQVNWDGRNDAGQRATPGIYFVRVEAGELLTVRKVTLLQ